MRMNNLLRVTLLFSSLTFLYLLALRANPMFGNLTKVMFGAQSGVATPFFLNCFRATM